MKTKDIVRKWQHLYKELEISDRQAILAFKRYRENPITENKFQVYDAQDRSDAAAEALHKFLNCEWKQGEET